MSATENKLLMQRLFAAVAAGERGLLNENLADDVTMTVTGQYSWSQTFRGKTAVLEDLHGHLRTLLVEPRRTIAFRFIAEGDYVVVEAKGDMTTRTGTRYDNDYCLIYRLTNGKIVEIREYLDSTLCERVLGPFPASLKQPDPADAIERKST